MVAPPTGAGTVAGIALSAARGGRATRSPLPGETRSPTPSSAARSHEIAGGLAELGIERGDHVAILAGTRPEWTLADLGALSAGATVVPIYQTNSPEECEYILGHAGVRAVFCEDAAQVAKVEQVRERCPQLEHVIVFDGEVPDTVSLGGAAGAGRRDGRRGRRRAARARRTAGRRDDHLHVRHHRTAEGLRRHPRQPARRPRRCTSASSSCRTAEMVIYLFLPLAHSLARVAQYATLEAGGTLAFWGGDPQRIVDELAEVRPTHFPSVPRIYEKVHSAVLDGVAERGPRSSARCSTGRCAEGARARAPPRGRLARARRRGCATALADRLVLSKVRALFGDRLAMALCGAAPIAPRGARVLRRLRRARARGLRHDRDVRRGDAQHAAGGALRLRRAARWRGPRWRSPRTARS